MALETKCLKHDEEGTRDRLENYVEISKSHARVPLWN
jgi:hypothetical protein